MASFKEDLLGEDPLISSQKFTCLSFLSPEEILKTSSASSSNSVGKTTNLVRNPKHCKLCAKHRQFFYENLLI